MQYVIETTTGEKLIGELVKMIKDCDIFGDYGKPLKGIWIKTKTELSFILQSEIKSKRPATNLDY